jgi:hypothetical protein
LRAFTVLICGALICAMLAAACSGGGSPEQQIRNRVQSFVAHYNEDDAKAILDNDVPVSFRRTCSDSEAKRMVSQARQLSGQLNVKSVDNITVQGNKATARVVLGTGQPLLPQTPPVTIPFVHEDGSWRFNISPTQGCNGLLPTNSVASSLALPALEQVEAAVE